MSIFYLLNSEVLILYFINILFFKRNKLFQTSLLRFYKLRLINNKFVFNIIYITLIKLTLRDCIKEL